jgi:membrane protein YdbS with pleckstrin-like domain
MTESLDGPAHESSGDSAIPERTREKLPSKSSKLSITSLALAIIALAVFWSVMVAAVFDVHAVDGVVFIVAAVAGAILGVGAVVLGVVARQLVRRGDASRAA